MQKFSILWLMPLVILTLNGCADRRAYGECQYRIQSGECYPTAKNTIEDADLIAESAKAIEQLLKNQDMLVQQNLSLRPSSPVIITSLVELGNLERSSGFGQTFAEMLGAHLNQQGFRVRDVRTRQDLLIEEQNGEMMLSRDLSAISQQHAINHVLVGTYTPAQRKVYISLKLLHISGEVLSSHVLSLPIGADTNRLLRQKAFWTAWKP
jgi:TolB-like protein